MERMSSDSARNQWVSSYGESAQETEPSWTEVLVSAALTGSVASIVSGGLLAALAKNEGKGPLQPVNATSHWLNGPSAGAQRHPDFAHTGVGYVTHHASAVFWALPMELWSAKSPNDGPWQTLLKAGAIAAAAAAFDYGVVPRRITPGWEHAVSTRGVAGGFVGLGLGLAVGALITRELRRRRH